MPDRPVRSLVAQDWSAGDVRDRKANGPRWVRMTPGPSGSRRARAAQRGFDAVAAMSDQLALGALREAAGQLRVSGWDDSDVTREHRLTTVAQSLREQGAACDRGAR